MTYWKIIMIVIKQMKLLMNDIKRESGSKDPDSPNKLTSDEIAFIVTDNLLELTPKIIKLIEPKE
tara:strand:+ start:13970 stop:14164 length:195 start_codon:yes stop_codon:yes gene_type:complete